MDAPVARRGMACRWTQSWLALSTVMVVAGTSVAAATTLAPSAQFHVEPPAPQEAVPPPPHRGAVTWLPGHWRWTGIAGTEWHWERGRYVAWPPGRAASVTSQWQATPNGADWIDDGQ